MTWITTGEIEGVPDEEGIVTVKDTYPPPFHCPTPKQEQFWDACWTPGVEEILFGGAIRSGKTQAAIKLITSWAWNYGGPNWKFVIMRKTYRELEDSTKAAFLRGDGKMPPGCPPQLIPPRGYKGKDEMVVLRNGAEILFRSGENPSDTEDKLRNVTLAGFFIDQVEEFDGKDYEAMYETMLSRMSDPRGPRKAILVANPSSEDHWVYTRFVDPLRKQEQTRYIHVTLDENKDNLPESYVRMMERRKVSNPTWYKRFVLGEWGAFGGKRYSCWDPAIHVVEPFPIPSGWEIVQGIDFGWSHPTAVIWCAIDFDGRWYVVAEHVESEKPISYHAHKIREIEKTLNISPSSRWMDPSTWAKRTEYESPGMEFADYGIEAGRAQNDRLGGWNRIEEMLIDRMEADSLPRLQVFSTCTHLIREIPNLRIKDGTDDVDKVNDDASDSLRYAIMSRMPSPEPPDPEEDLDRRDVYAKRIMERFKMKEGEAVV